MIIYINPLFYFLQFRLAARESETEKSAHMDKREKECAYGKKWRCETENFFDHCAIVTL